MTLSIKLFFHNIHLNGGKTRSKLNFDKVIKNCSIFCKSRKKNRKLNYGSYFWAVKIIEVKYLLKIFKEESFGFVFEGNLRHPIEFSGVEIV